MSGLIRAELLRFRKRRSLQVIVIAVPLLVAFFFVAGIMSFGQELPPCDSAAIRDRLIGEGFVEGMPPEEIEPLLADAVAQECQFWEQQREQMQQVRSTYAFPQSLVTVLGSGTFMLFALILLTATTIGDDFGWATIRTTLLASSHRVRLLAVRLGALGAIALGLIASLLVLGVSLPATLGAVGVQLPPAAPVNVAGLAVLVAALFEGGLVVIAFAAMATLLVRSGSLTLVVMLVYVVVEAAILTLLLQFDAFKHDGPMEWLLDAFPVRGLSTLMEVASRVASSVPRYEGDIIRDLGDATVPMVALLVWATLFGAIAFRRFARMDIAE
jgi:ABC-type transport system involved in multi-copper enzyme maturation permease subunit